MWYITVHHSMNITVTYYLAIMCIYNILGEIKVDEDGTV